LGYKTLILAILLITTIYSTLISQDSDDIYIFGYVTDSISGRVVRNVLVEAVNESDSTQRCSTYSDNTGRYILNFNTGNTPVEDHEKVPFNFRLWQNYPNPFNPITRINFQLPYPCNVRLVIYDILGKKIKTLINEYAGSGSHSVIWDATSDLGIGVSAGIYFYQLRAGDFVETKKMMLLDGSYSAPHASSPSFLHNEGKNFYLYKPANITVTIKASGSLIIPYEQNHIIISSEFFRHDIDVTVLSCSLINRDSVLVS